MLRKIAYTAVVVEVFALTICGSLILHEECLPKIPLHELNESTKAE
jgi:hypothetical protein